ncbi:MAG: glucose 1-dehydrogenase [Nevskia sp.]|nr:glucose 1-dehydrogenase [Nevskia sp.]
MIDYGKLFRLDGKSALVSGAARGIGAAIAEALAQAGASVLITDILERAGQETVERIRRAGGKAAFFTHDVTDEAQWQAAIARAEKEFGPLEVLVNNAGIETAALLSQCTLQDFSNVMNVNVNGVFLGLKHAVRAMSPGGSSGRGGSIVNMSSAAGLVGTTGHIAYHASKGAVRLLTKAAAVECAQLQTGIRVNSVHPAIVGTDMGDNFIKHLVELKLAPDADTAAAAMKAAHPMGHFGEPSDVAAAVLYLASAASKWVTGTELVPDGGYTAA